MTESSLDTETLAKYFRQNEFLYAGYRGIYTRRNDQTIPEEDTVPLLRSVLFPLAIFAYVVMKRIYGIVSTDTQEHQAYDHVFSITSTDEYRVYPLLRIAERLQKEGDDVLLLCTPGGEPRIEEWSEIATVQRHKELHGSISVLTLVLTVLTSLREARRLLSIINISEDIYDLIFAYNLILLEHIKYHSIQPVTDGEPAIHTMKPMPYFTESTNHTNIYVYQHGVQLKQNQTWPGLDEAPDYDLKSAIPFYIPLTYFIWGESWKKTFEQVAHPEASIIVTGNPWYDHLAELDQDNQTQDIDLLFISQPREQRNTSRKDRYEKLVREVITLCEESNLKLAIKLHPRESIGWYAERGWDKYIEEFNDIDTALLRSSMAVTDMSTAFIEASLLNTPILLTDIYNTGIKRLGRSKNVFFADDIADLESAIANLRKESGNVKDNNLIHVGSSVERITLAINDNN